jgi:hypothetical protein
MTCDLVDRELLRRLSDIPEIALCGFGSREGLAGTGVTVFKGRNYFGSWRATEQELLWTYADLAQPGYAAQSVDEAVRYTLLLILRNLDMPDQRLRPQARTG